MNILVSHKSELHMLAGWSVFIIISILAFTCSLLAEALLKYETLDADDIKSIIEHKKPPTSKLSQASSILGLKPGLASPLSPVPALPGLGVTAIPPNEALGKRNEPS